MADKLTTDELFAKLKPIIVEKLGVEGKDVNMESNFKLDLGADSLDTVELSMEFEKEFQISILDEDLEKILSVADAIKCIETELGKK